MNPNTDGIDHINIYSKGQTELGRFLSNFAHSPIETEDGNFTSIEGYWYWLGCTHKNKDLLRGVYGYKAKQLGRDLRAEDWPSFDGFQDKISRAIVIKLDTYPDYKEQLLNSTLPLVHYYTYGNNIIQVPEANWIIKVINETRENHG